MSDELARVLAEHPWRPNWWRCGRTCEWVPNGDMHVTAQHTEHLADVTLAWFAARPSVPAVTSEQVDAGAQALHPYMWEPSYFPFRAHGDNRSHRVLVEATRDEVRANVRTVLAAMGIEVTP